MLPKLKSLDRYLKFWRFIKSSKLEWKHLSGHSAELVNGNETSERRQSIPQTFILFPLRCNSKLTLAPDTQPISTLNNSSASTRRAAAGGLAEWRGALPLGIPPWVLNKRRALPFNYNDSRCDNKVVFSGSVPDVTTRVSSCCSFSFCSSSLIPASTAASHSPPWLVCLVFLWGSPNFQRSGCVGPDLCSIWHLCSPAGHFTFLV